MTWKESWQSVREPIRRLVLTLVVVALAWYGFLRLVIKLHVDEDASLVMVWLSALVVLLALFPKVVDALKKVKVGEFEFELQEAVVKSSLLADFSLADLDEQQVLTAEKRGLDALPNLLQRAIDEPTRPILLTANLKDGQYISKPVLYTYVLFLEHVAPFVTVFFVSSTATGTVTGLGSDAVVGAVSGRTLLQVFRQRLPWFVRQAHPPTYDTQEDEFFEYKRIPSPDFFQAVRGAPWFPADAETLSREEVREWFGSRLNSRPIDARLRSDDLQEIRRALELREEFVICYEEGRFRSVVSLREFSQAVAKAALAEAKREKK